MNFDKRTLHRVLGGFLIFVALVALATGKVVDTTSRSQTRYARRPIHVISKSDDPTLFYMEVLITMALGGFLIYHASREE